MSDGAPQSMQETKPIRWWLEQALGDGQVRDLASPSEALSAFERLRIDMPRLSPGSVAPPLISVSRWNVFDWMTLSRDLGDLWVQATGETLRQRTGDEWYALALKHAQEQKGFLMREDDLADISLLAFVAAHSIESLTAQAGASGAAAGKVEVLIRETSLLVENADLLAEIDRLELFARRDQKRIEAALAENDELRTLLAKLGVEDPWSEMLWLKSRVAEMVADRNSFAEQLRRGDLSAATTGAQAKVLVTKLSRFEQVMLGVTAAASLVGAANSADQTVNVDVPAVVQPVIGAACDVADEFGLPESE